MSLRDEISGAAPAPPGGYTLLTPPDWGRFTADEDGRRELIALLTSRFREVGRPDLDAETRASVNRQWTRMASAHVMEVFMPVQATREGATPMTISASPWVATGELEADVRRRAGADVLRLEIPDIGTVYRWVTERGGPDGMPELKAREIGYVVAFPGEAPTRGLLLMCSIIHLGIEESGPALDAFTDLSDSIVSTMRWRYAQ
jgi:hypothetical protein